MKIRIATKDDANTLSAVARQTWCETFPDNLEPCQLEQLLNEKFSIELLQTELQDDETVYVLAFDDSEIIGYAKLIVSDKDEIMLDKLYVIQSKQRRGIGKALLDFCIAHAVNTEHNTMWLTVWEHNDRAIAFYEKMGFYKLNQKVPYELPGKTEYDYKMVVKNLNSRIRSAEIDPVNTPAPKKV